MFKNDKLQKKREAQFQSTEGWLLVGRERVPCYIGGQSWRRSWQRMVALGTTQNLSHNCSLCQGQIQAVGRD